RPFSGHRRSPLGNGWCGCQSQHGPGARERPIDCLLPPPLLPAAAARLRLAALRAKLPEDPPGTSLLDLLSRSNRGPLPDLLFRRRARGGSDAFHTRVPWRRTLPRRTTSCTLPERATELCNPGGSASRCSRCHPAGRLARPDRWATQPLARGSASRLRCLQLRRLCSAKPEGGNLLSPSAAGDLR